MPSGTSAEACKLLKGLLNRNVQARLGTARSTMFEVGGVAGLKAQPFFGHIDWVKLEKKEIVPPETLAVENEHDLKHFHDEFVNMTLPRSVVEMNADDFQPRRVESDLFKGFSFIQDDFGLPHRHDSDIQKYWEGADEDGESVSEVASSKLDDEEEVQPVEPEKKKRPPRKRKKKNKLTASAPNSTCSTPAPSAPNSPPGSEKGENDDTVISAETTPVPIKPDLNVAKGPLQPTLQASEDANIPTAKQSTTLSARIEQQKTELSPRPAQNHSSVRKEGSWNEVSGTSGKPVPTTYNSKSSQGQKGAQRPAWNSTSATGQQSQKQSSPWASAQKSHLVARTSAPTAQPQASLHQPAAKPMPQSGWEQAPISLPQRMPRPSSQSGWQQAPTRSHKGGPNRFPQAAGAGWKTPAPIQKTTSRNDDFSENSSDTAPSTDWRQHAMSPRSGKSIRQQSSNSGTVSWPTLGAPASAKASAQPKTGKTPGSLSAPPRKLQGAWATRK